MCIKEAKIVYIFIKNFNDFKSACLIILFYLEISSLNQHLVLNTVLKSFL